MLIRHALRNAVIPTVTVLGVNIGFLVGGTLVVEQVFALPGHRPAHDQLDLPARLPRRPGGHARVRAHGRARLPARPTSSTRCSTRGCGSTDGRRCRVAAVEATRRRAPARLPAAAGTARRRSSPALSILGLDRAARGLRSADHLARPDSAGPRCNTLAGAVVARTGSAPTSSAATSGRGSSTARRIDLRIAFLAVLFPFVLGTFARAALRATTGGSVDTVVERLVDVVVAFPFYVLIIALVFVLGPGTRNIYIAITIVGWVSYARIVRGEVLVAKRQEYVLAAQRGGPLERAHHRAPPAAERDHAGDRLRDVRHRARHPRHRHARLPRPRRPAADAGLGVDDRRRAAVPHDALAARDVPRPRGRHHRRSASRCSATASPTCCGRSDGRAAALDVRDLRVEFPLARGVVRAVDGVSLRRRAAARRSGSSASPAAARRMTLRAILGLLPRTARDRRRRDRSSTARTSLALDEDRRRDAARARDRDDLPGADDGAQPGHARRRPDRRGPARPARATADGAARERALELMRRVGIPDPERRARRLPARALGRPAPARHDRDRALVRAAAAPLRRADDGARRDDPGSDPEAACRRCASELERQRRLRHARPRGRRADLPARRRHVRGRRSSRPARSTTVFREPRHPYTLGLLRSVPDFDERAGDARRRSRARRPTSLRRRRAAASIRAARSRSPTAPRATSRCAPLGGGRATACIHHEALRRGRCAVSR